MNALHSFVRWDADAIAGWEREAPTVDDDAYARVVLLSPAAAAGGTREVIPSWGADTPPWTWIELQLRACTSGAWGRWFRVAAWDSAGSDSHRTSFDNQRGLDGELSTDTLLLTTPAEALQARVLLCAEPGAAMPELESLALCFTAVDGESPPTAQPADPGPQSAAIGMPLLISQYLADPIQGHRWCSPTSMAMLLAYWHETAGDPRLAPFARTEAMLAFAVPLCFDPGWEGTGNWAFNTAFAANLGLTAYVTRLQRLSQLARWIAAGVPVAISFNWTPGQLVGAIGSGSGHIAIVRGFAGERVLMAEPAAHEVAAITRSYDAHQLQTCWQQAGGAVYIVHPRGWPRPAPRAGDAWA